MTRRTYRTFTVEIYEIGHDQWHARIWRSDDQTTIIDAETFIELELGVAWSSEVDAFLDACRLIDRLSHTVT
jgi:hypothetical protein